MKISHVQEFESIKKTDKLWCNKWSDASWVTYLNLINFEPKERTAWIPWGNIPTPEKDVLQLCKSELYSLYKFKTLKHINSCPAEQVPASIDKLLRVYRILGTGGDELYRDLVEMLAARDCSHLEVLSDIWKCICRSESTKREVFEAALDKTSTRVLTYTLRVARQVKFGFWGAWFGHPMPSFQYCPVTDALLNGKVEQLTILLRNGFQQNVHRVCTYDKVFKAPINPAYCWLRTPLTQPSTPGRRRVLTEVLLFLLLVYQCRSHRLSRFLVECFHLLWDNTDTALVSAAELAREMAGRFRDCPPELQLSETPFRHLFRLLFEPRADPRTLQHLCRCRVRRTLAHNLPDGARELPLPDRLREYVTEV